MKTLHRLLLALPLLAAAGAAHAAGYSGNYLVTFTHAHPNGGSGGNGNQYCFTLVDDGSVLGWAHGGPLSISGGVAGQFFVAGKTLAGSFSFSGADVVITGIASGGVLNATAWAAVLNGLPVASGEVKTGAKGSC
jgi:hypothetical protein